MSESIATAGGILAIGLIDLLVERGVISKGDVGILLAQAHQKLTNPSPGSVQDVLANVALNNDR